MKKAKVIAIIALVLVLGTVVFQNRQSVEIRFLMISVTMPQVVLLVLTIAGGFCLGLLAALRGKGKR